MNHKLSIVTFLALVLLLIVGSESLAEPRRPIEFGDKVRVSTATSHHNTKLGFVLGIKKDTLLVGARGDVRISRVIKTVGTSIDFPFTGAQYDTLSRSLFGISQSGDSVSIPVTEIDHIEMMWRVNGRDVQIKLSSRTLHNRLRFSYAYPEVLYRIPLDSIQTLKRFKQGHSSLIILGVLAGGTIGYYSSKFEEGNKLDTLVQFLESGFGIKILVSIVGGAIVGGLIGYILGRSTWESVAVDKLRVSLVPVNRNGFGVSLAIRF